MDATSDPNFGPEETAEIRRGVAEFNEGRFFECHDTIEEVWQGTRGPARRFLQGLIQAAVGFYHLGNGNLRGGESQLRQGLEKLEEYPGNYAGIDLASLRAGLGEWLEKVRRGDNLRSTIADLPKIRFYDGDNEI